MIATPPKTIKEYWERIKQHEGLGDTIADVLSITRLDKLKNSNCNCEKRKETLNKLFPYQKR